MELPIIEKGIADLAPDFRAISILVDATTASEGAMTRQVLEEACDFVRAGGPEWSEAHMASWGDVYARFGAKPNRTPCSAQALRKRVEKDGRIPSINPLVDLYNAVSLRYAVPVGGENFDAYVGLPRLSISDGTEPFDTIANGESVTETPVKGEIVWRDDVGVTCRRWNWRQGTRTRLDAIGGKMWFILESLGTMPESALEEAGNMLVNGLTQLAPGSQIERRTIAVA
ncbi:B3/B4 domain-containing protein [Neorhizobium alkalisoli]|uniref:B3/B4 domain-containing protein n=1 Tax=Neorhizobium alkalisoli TaxID=528178 RepID=UPI000CF96B2E|nr:B3/4 domain-containing protein [Neorhizobium alkalisoli]